MQNINDSSELLGGYKKKLYEEVGKKSVCGKKRVIYKKTSGKTSSKEYMKHKGKYVQVKNFVKAMVAAGKWKEPKKTKAKKSPKPCKEDQHRNPATGRCVKNKAKKSPKPCKEDQHRNPATGRCVKNKVPKSPKKRGRPRKTSVKRSA